MSPEEQGTYDAEKGTEEPITFMDWCFENGRKWTKAANFEEFATNAKDYEQYRAAFFAHKGQA